MFDHVTLRASDRAASERFYTTVLPTLGIEPTAPLEWDDFSLAAVGDGEAVTRGLHIGFVAPTREHADAFWRAGTEAGYRDDGAPGPRPEYGDGLREPSAAPPATLTTARPASGRSTTRATTAPTCSIRMGTTSRSSTTADRRPGIHKEPDLEREHGEHDRRHEDDVERTETRPGAALHRC